MRVFVAGATGVAGGRAVRDLVAAGHDVTGVARTPEKARLLRRLGASPIEADLFDADEVQAAVQGQEAIVNLATRIPSLGRASLPGAWRENERIRTYVSRNLVDGGLAAGVGIYVQESLAFVYPDRGEAWIDEDVVLSPPRYARAILDAERHALRSGARGGRAVVLRFGQFYAHDSIHTRSMIAAARRGMSPFVGPKEAFFPVVHADDVGRAVVAALEVPSGIYNIVDDEPLRQGALAAALAAAVGVERLRFPPPWLVRLGGDKTQALMRSQRVSNGRFREATDWRPSHVNALEGFRSTVEELDRLRSLKP